MPTRRNAPAPRSTGPLVIGFTGTRAGMTPAQTHTVDALLARLAAEHPARPLTALHGDCLGADADFDALCKRRNVPVKILPADIPAMRAHCESEPLAPPQPPLARNRQIVATSNLIIACPRTRDEVLRSGVWATIRAMRRKPGPVYLVIPDGTLTLEPTP